MKPRTKKIVRLFGIAVLMLLLLYVGSYAALSVGGRYEPAGIGLNGVKFYAWAPRGFVKDYVWNHPLQCVYFPLYVLDIDFWHPIVPRYEEEHSKYPINKVKSEDIGKVFRANGF
jgi:hypothetical protein